MAKATYKSAGVDLDIYRESMSRLPALMHRTFSPRVMRLDGGFAGLFQLDFGNRLFARHYQDPVLVSGTDGVGTKLKVAQLAGKHDTVGIDLVAMCVNDVICCGAEPLFFLDYVAMSHDDPNLLEQVVSGISDGCVLADSALLGGETAIMPDMYTAEDYDLAGFSVGVVERAHLITGGAMTPGDAVIGIASSGVHSNGFSLVRKVVFELNGLKVTDPVPQLGQTVGETLLTPTLIYARAIRAVQRHYTVKNVIHGIAHITGGGLFENVERIVPENIQLRIGRDSWPVLPVFRWLQQLGDIDEEEMFRVFNMGIGMVLIVSNFYADAICRLLTNQNLNCWQIGRVVEGPRGVVWDE
jgi:phosphoribosylformylglycinamidine cyclo-ligase